MNPTFPLDEFPHYPNEVMETFGKLTHHAIIANGSYGKKSAETLVTKGSAELVSFGSLFLANPDLPKRFELDAALNQPDRATMFGGGAKGYTDYTFLN